MKLVPIAVSATKWPMNPRRLSIVAALVALLAADGPWPAFADSRSDSLPRSLPSTSHGVAQDTLTGRVMQFVFRLYAGGVPFDSGRALGPEAHDLLASLLSDERNKPYWSNIVAGIAFSGGPGSLEVLRSFVCDRFHGKLDDETFHAIIQATAVVGTVPAGSNPELFPYLARAVDPGFWKAVPWEPPIVMARDDLAVWFSNMSISTLGFTGSRQADAILSRLKAAPFSATQIPLIDETIEKNGRVELLGLSEYLREERTHSGIRTGSGR